MRRLATRQRWPLRRVGRGSESHKYPVAKGPSRRNNLEYYGQRRTYGPGSWEPTAPYFYYPPEEPFAPGWRTWALDRASEFRPVRPELATESYVDALREVLAFSPDKLTDYQKRVALFWADGRGTVTPPSHSNLTALDLVRQSKLSSEEVVQLFALLNLALADAFVAAWYAKYAYCTMRPVTAAKKLLGVNFTPLILTPAFPSYVSGHASFSGAAATVLAKYFADKAATVQAMAGQAAMSRLYGVSIFGSTMMMDFYGVTSGSTRDRTLWPLSAETPVLT